MKPIALLFSMAVTVSFLSISAAAADTRVDAAMVLEQAAHAEMVEGDLAQAALLYRQIAMSASASRNHVARALVALGNTYELQGSPEAIPVFERVVSEFSDQPELFLAATAKLNAMSTNASSGAAAGNTVAEYKLVLQEIWPAKPSRGRRYDFSPDGSKFIIAALPTTERKKRFPGLLRELYVRDTSGSVGRALIEDAEDWEFVSLPRWSPNGQYILYTLHKESGDEKRLMLLDLRAQLAKQLPRGYLQDNGLMGAEWMPDSSGFLVQSNDGFRIISLDGAVKKRFIGKRNHTIGMGNVSPDGRYLLYHKVTANKDDDSEVDIWRLDLESGEHSEMSNDPGFEGWPVWSRDGKHIYYVSGPEAARNVFRRTAGSDEPPVRVTSYSNASATHPLVLPEGGQLTFVLMKDNHVILTADTRDVDSPHTVVRGSTAMLSPDGKFIYYLDNQPGRVGMWKVSVKGDNPHQLVSGTVLTSYGAKRSSTLLSPDGSRIAYSQHIGDATALFVMSSSGGTATELYSTDGIRRLIPAWSPDGKEIAFSIDGDLIVIPSEGGDTTILGTVKGWGWDSWNLEWSPDGKSIAAFAYLEGENENVLFIINRASKAMRRVTPESEDKYKEILAWHPDGNRISYMYYNPEDGNGSRIADLETGQISDLVDMPDPMWDYIGAWGPDKRYYFISTVRGQPFWGLYSFDEGLKEYKTIRQLNDRDVSLPSWSSNGKRMAWAEMEPVRQLWMMTNYE